MNSDKMLNNWVNEMKEYYDLETSEAWTIEDLNDTLIEISFNQEPAPEWLDLYLEAMDEFYALDYEREAFTAEIYNEELRRLFMRQDTVVEMPAKSKNPLSAAI